ncbi:MAG: hypothetical protein BWK76_23380 [Desulfobulbaceae bacterium A2]|nr:MAG: hypothetical protein BWK76_23380 [Desulfobulbaceae bacterium A2]
MLLYEFHFLPTHSTVENDQIRDSSFQAPGQFFKMFLTFGQNQRRSPFSHSLQDILLDKPITRAIGKQLVIKVMELNPGIRIGRFDRVEAGGTNNNGMSKGPFPRQGSRIDPMAHGAALHENDRMLAVLACDGGRQARDEFRFRPTGNLCEALGG